MSRRSCTGLKRTQCFELPSSLRENTKHSYTYLGARCLRANAKNVSNIECAWTYPKRFYLSVLCSHLCALLHLPEKGVRPSVQGRPQRPARLGQRGWLTRRRHSIPVNCIVSKSKVTKSIKVQTFACFEHPSSLRRGWVLRGTVIPNAKRNLSLL